MPDDVVPIDEVYVTKSTGRKKSDAIAAIILIVISGFIIYKSLQLPLFSEYSPGPGMFPFGLGLILFVLSAALLWDGVNPKVKDKPSKFQNKKGLLASLLMALGLIGYTLLISRLGYLLTTFLLVLFLMKIVAGDKVKTTLLTAASVTFLLYLIFDVALGVHLPKGFLNF